jgi:hypothetical protein
MHTVINRARLTVPVILGAATLPGVGLLLVWDIFPSLFPIRAHNLLAAFPLAAIAVAYLAYQAERRPAPGEFFKAVLLAMAFLCWAANQLWPSWRQATVLNDTAIALFVFDIFLVMIGWPTTYRDQALGDTCVKTGGSR